MVSLIVEEIANVFEGTVNYSLTDLADNKLIELYTLSPKDGSIQDLLQIGLSAP